MIACEELPVSTWLFLIVACLTVGLTAGALLVRTSGAQPSTFLAELGTLIRRPRAVRGRRMEATVSAPVLLTARLHLRPHQMSDATTWHRFHLDPDITRFLPWPRRTPDEARVHLRARTRRRELEQADDFLALAVELDGELIGDVSLQLRAVAREVRSVEVGWVLDPAYGGRGLATEAAAAAIAFAFAAVHARHVTAVIDPANRSSLALARRLGFTEVDRSERSVLFTVSERAFAGVRGLQLEQLSVLNPVHRP